MKSTSDTRKPYTGSSRSLVIALDVGTTFSGVSYAILEPGEIPKIHGVTRSNLRQLAHSFIQKFSRFPGQEHVAGNSKIPSVMYYDKAGNMTAAGAEAETSSTISIAEDEEWIRVELFKLRLRPMTMKLDMNGMRLGPLPNGKTAVHVFADYLYYLFQCTKNFIVDTHGNGAALWAAVEGNMQFVLSHPNGWEGAQQTKMRRAAVYAQLIPDTNEGKSRIRFVTEGEASLHACVLSGLASDVLSDSSLSSAGFLVADAGGGTLDISSYTIIEQQPLVIEEIAPPDCIFAGSVFVSRRAKEFLTEKLKNSKYGTPDAVEHITKRFDETTKRLFRDKKGPQFIPFGSPLDKDLSVGIRSGQLKLTGEEVAALFEPSIEAAVKAIKGQIKASKGVIKSVFLVGGYAASGWLFHQLQERLSIYQVSVSRPDTQTSKAVADGAIGFYCDHHVSARVSKFMYGVEYLRQYDPNNPEHTKRKDRLCELPSGPKLLLDAFDCILARNTKVKESSVFTRKYSTELTSLSTLSIFEVEIWCYRGGNSVPDWILRDNENFSTLCHVRADLSPLSGSAEPKTGPNGKTYWTIIFSVEIHFGLTEFRARIKWNDKGIIKYGPASIIYNERGHRAEEDEPDYNPDDDASSPSTLEYVSRPVSRTSSRHPTISGSSKRSSRLGSGLPEEYIPSGPPSRAESISQSGRSREHESVDRGRSLDKGKQKEAHSNPRHRDSTASTTTSNRLGETLSSVWGSLASPARSVASLDSPRPTSPRIDIEHPSSATLGMFSPSNLGSHVSGTDVDPTSNTPGAFNDVTPTSGSHAGATPSQPASGGWGTGWGATLVDAARSLSSVVQPPNVDTRSSRSKPSTKPPSPTTLTNAESISRNSIHPSKLSSPRLGSSSIGGPGSKTPRSTATVLPQEHISVPQSTVDWPTTEPIISTAPEPVNPEIVTASEAAPANPPALSGILDLLARKPSTAAKSKATSRHPSKLSSPVKVENTIPEVVHAVELPVIEPPIVEPQAASSRAPTPKPKSGKSSTAPSVKSSPKPSDLPSISAKAPSNPAEALAPVPEAEAPQPEALQVATESSPSATIPATVPSKTPSRVPSAKASPKLVETVLAAEVPATLAPSQSDSKAEAGKTSLQPTKPALPVDDPVIANPWAGSTSKPASVRPSPKPEATAVLPAETPSAELLAPPVPSPAEEAPVANSTVVAPEVDAKPAEVAVESTEVPPQEADELKEEPAKADVLDVPADPTPLEATSTDAPSIVPEHPVAADADVESEAQTPATDEPPTPIGEKGGEKEDENKGGGKKKKGKGKKGKK